MSDHSHHTHFEGEVCPLCDQDIPHEKFAEIKENIERKQRERFAEFEQTLKARLEAENAKLTAKAKEDIEEANRIAVERLEQTKTQSAEQERKAVEAVRNQVKSAFTGQLNAAKKSNRELAQMIEQLRVDKLAKVKLAQEMGSAFPSDGIRR